MINWWCQGDLNPYSLSTLGKSQLLCRSSSDTILMIVSVLFYERRLSIKQTHLKLVVSKGIEPLSIAYQARALPLSYETIDFETLTYGIYSLSSPIYT